MAADKWGIPFLYPTKLTAGLTKEGQGFFWQQNNDFRKDNQSGMIRLGKEQEDCELINSSTGEWEFPFLEEGDGLSFSGSTGHHTGGENHGCQGFAYMCDSNLDENPPTFRFRKEMYHSLYSTHSTGEWTNSKATGPCKDKWKGFAWVRYNKKDGRGTGKDSVILEAWWNNDPDNHLKDGWVMLKRIEDKGGWGKDGDSCNGANDQVGTWSNIQFRFKSGSSDFSLHPLIPEGEDDPVVHSIGKEDMDFAATENRGYGKREDMPRDIEMKCLFKWDAGGDGKCHFKNISLREIDPNRSFDDDPDQPDPSEQPQETQTIQGKFKLQWDLNSERASECAGIGVGGFGGTSIFYDVQTVDESRVLANTATHDFRTRQGQQVISSTTSFHGKLIKQFDVLLKKTNSPTGNITAKIWNSSGSVVYTSSTSVVASGLTTSFDLIPFDFSDNTHVIVVGERIGVQYTSGTDTDYVSTGIREEDVETGYRASYNDDTDTWYTFSSSDFCCRMWT